MKKSAFLLAGVAVLALSATAASAQTVGGFIKGQYVDTFFGIPVGTNNVSGLNAASTQNAIRANNSQSAVSAWHAVGVSIGNVGGNGDASDGATFSLTGNVTEDCAFYTGTSNALSFDFGQIGVYVSDNTGPAAAFTMVAPAVMNFDTNLAGCNTANSVTITKNSADGLINSGNNGGYDSNVFQANLPFSVEAKYTAAAHNAVANGSQQTLSVASTALSNVANHGAWKSPFSLAVNIPVASKALLAGNYEGTVAVQIQAF